MNSFFRNLPLPYKLILIAIIPIVFVIYLSIQLYLEKSQQVKLTGDYVEKIHESGNINNLMDAMQTERRYSFENALTKKKYDSVIIQRKVTDSALSLLKQSKDLSLTQFPEYTFIKDLPKIRLALDTSKNYSANTIMQFYTASIFRLSTLNAAVPVSNTYLSSVYKDLVAQKLLFEMITFLGIIRTNIYYMLYTRQYTVETLMGTVDVYDVYNSYETEFRLKASPVSVQQYKYIKENTSLKPTTVYIDKLFKTHKFEGSYTADDWWSTSTHGINEMRKLQKNLRTSVEARMNRIYKSAITGRNTTLFFLITALVLIIMFIAYTIKVISRMLEELRIAAQKISEGSTDMNLKNMPDDVMGKLAYSILQINENNKKLAFAADAIGKGNFTVELAARSEDDVLGNSIVRMKNDLLQYSLQKDRIQNEILDLLHKKDDFMSIASHELKTPITALKAYAQILQIEAEASGDKAKEMMFEKMNTQVDKLTFLINDLLDTSKLREGELIYNRQPVKFNEVVKEIIDEIQRTIPVYEIILENNPPLTVLADKDRIRQVISNLLTNAVKYCRNCNINVNVEIRNKKVLCSVHDDGIGIAKDQLEKIFERFYRAPGPNLHTYPGLGLGLYISREIIEHHDGEIWVESEPEKGTTFYFTLPVMES
jgi:signal transduction histidine kinase